MKKCPYCAEEIQDKAVICRFCGKEIDKKQGPIKDKSSEWIGVVALATAGLSLFLLPIIFAPLGFIFASVALTKGKKAVGFIAMILSIISLVIVLSTFQSCSRSLTSISSFKDEYMKPTVEKVKSEKRIKLVDIDAKVASKDDTFYRYSWKLTLKNLADRHLTVDVNIQYLDIGEFEVFHDREFDLPLAPYTEKTFTGTTNMMAEDGIKVKSVKAVITRVNE